MIARTAGRAALLSGLLALLLAEAAAAHDGEHAQASKGFQYTEELLAVGAIAGLAATILAVSWVRGRGERVDA